MMRVRLLALMVLVATGCSSSSGVKSSSTGVSSTAPPASAGSAAPAEPATPAVAPPAPTAKVHKLASGVVYEDVVVGNGKMADPGLSVAINYTGRLTDGTKIDSSFDRGKPLTFTLGGGQMIPGLEEGVRGMRIGGKRKITIPPDLAYGAQGSQGVVPPNATLIFDVELLGVH